MHQRSAVENVENRGLELLLNGVEGTGRARRIPTPISRKFASEKSQLVEGQIG